MCQVDDDALTGTGLADLEAVGAGRLDLRVRGAEGACDGHVRGGEPPGLMPLVDRLLQGDDVAHSAFWADEAHVVVRVGLGGPRGAALCGLRG